MECKTAELVARVVKENMERHETLERPFLRDFVFEPLKMLVDKISMHQDEYRYDTTESSNGNSDSASHSETNDSKKAGSIERWKNIEARLSALDKHVTKSIHEDLPQVRSQQLSNLMVDLREISKEGRRRRLDAAKAEANLARMIEDVAGRVLCAPYREEHAARCTSLELMKQNVELPEKLGEDEYQKLSKEIQTIRQELARQRQARKEKDENIQQLIETKALAIQRSLIESFGDTTE